METKDSQEPQTFHWEWLGNKCWENFDQLNSILIESVFIIDPTGILDLNFEDEQYTVDLQKMIMINQNNKSLVKNIQRTSNTQQKKYNQKIFKWERSRKRFKLTLATAHINPYKLQPFYDSLEESKRKTFFENLMNYGLTVTKGDTSDPFLLAVKDLEERSFEIWKEEKESEKDKRKEEYEKEKLERKENKKMKEDEKVEIEDQLEKIEDTLTKIKKDLEIEETEKKIEENFKQEQIEKKESKSQSLFNKLNLFGKLYSKEEPIKYEIKKEKPFISEIIQETKEFLNMNEKYHGYFSIFLKESSIERPPIENYLNDLIIIKYKSHDEKGIQLEFEKSKINLQYSSNKHQDITFKFKTDDKTLKPIIKETNQVLKKTKRYLSISNVISIFIYQIHLKKEMKKFIQSKKDVDQTLEKNYIRTWGEKEVFNKNLLQDCFEYLEKQKKLFKQDDVIFKRSTSPFIWLISLKFPKDTMIYQDLEKHSKKFDREETVELEIKFKYNFPETGPFIRIIEPRFIYSTGNITSQGIFSLDWLSNWNPLLSMELVIHLIQTDLIESKARIDMRTDKLYQVKPNWERKKMFEKKEKKEKKDDEFIHEYFAFSGDFAQRCFNSFFNHRLERANNLIFPRNTEYKLPNDNNSEPLTFEIISDKIKCYCGVLETSAPKKCVIIPNWMMKDLNLDEGSKIQLKLVQLPVCEFVTFQPLSKRFYKIKNTEFALTETLRPFTTLHEGQVIPLSTGNVEMLLQVISCQPSSAVRCQVAKNQFLDLKLDFQPAIDFDEELFKQNVSFKKMNSPPKDEEKKIEKKDSLSTMELSKEDGIECDNCKRSIAKQSLDIHKIHCLKNYFICKMCNQVVKITEKKIHEDTQHKIIDCDICKEKMEFYKFKIHQETCKKVQCIFCKMEFEPLKIHSHQIKCSFIEEQCLDCGNLCMRKYMIEHLKSCQREEQDHQRGFLKFFGRNKHEIEDELIEDELVEEEKQIEKEEEITPIPIIGQYTCSYCQESNLTKEKLTQHIIDKHPDDPEHLMETLNFLF